MTVQKHPSRNVDCDFFGMMFYSLGKFLVLFDSLSSSIEQDAFQFMTSSRLFVTEMA